LARERQVHPYSRDNYTMKSSDDNSYKAAFFITPSYILDLPGLTLCYLRVYETIFQFWNHGKPCYLSLKRIGERTKVSESQICEALNFFENAGELIRRKRNGKRYFVQPERAIVDDCIKNTPDSGGAESALRQSGVRPSGGAEYNNKKINKENNLKPLVDLQSTDYRENVLFMLWYSMYPNKQKPSIAFKAFCKLKPTPTFVQYLIDDVRNRLENNWSGRPKDKIPHPSTYLNQREWEGDIYPSNNNNSARRSLSAEDVLRA
jgi:hypothetical protein